MIGLIDGNSFFVSCERVFRPDLEGKPVIVVSGNDGCVIARSPEAKALKIGMSAPLFTIKDIIKEHNVQIFPCNFELYGDLSKRMMTIIQESVPLAEVYSIDESFLDLSGIANPESLLLSLQKRIHQGIGIPTCVGLASNKTLAKMANHIAKDKKIPLFHLQDSDDDHFKTYPVADIWGVGAKTAESLRASGIYTSFDLKFVDPRWMRQRFSVVGERIVRELNGIKCMNVDDDIDPKQSIRVSKSFTSPITNLAEMQQAVALYSEDLGVKIRANKTVTNSLWIYMRSSPYNNMFVTNSETITLPYPTNDTNQFLLAAMPVVEKLFQKGVCYKKAGVMASNLIPENTAHRRIPTQTTLFQDSPTEQKHDPKKQKELHQSLDRLNQRYGKGTIHFAASGTTRAFLKTPENRSPRYTTRWNELLKVK
jgi:DNA polymerase V